MASGSFVYASMYFFVQEFWKPGGGVCIGRTAHSLAWATGRKALASVDFD